MITPAPYYRTIIDLHERGYSDDFQLVGKGIFWVQQKIILPGSEFAVLDHRRVHVYHARRRHVIILGILLVTHDVKGILICRISVRPAQFPGTLQQQRTGIHIHQELQGDSPYPTSNNLLLKIR